MAFAADQNGYPGPMHVLELRERLGLTRDQAVKAEALMRTMFEESRPKSARLLEAEARLRRLFADGTADEAAVRTAVADGGAGPGGRPAGASPHAPPRPRSADRASAPPVSRDAMGSAVTRG